jgi:hypothetical protein
VTEPERGEGEARRERIAEWLDDDKARWFAAALRVLSDKDNPDAVALAAHDLREILEKLPRESNERSLKEVTKDLLGTWRSMTATTKALQSGAWTGSIDAPLAGFLENYDAVFCGCAPSRLRSSMRSRP